MPTAIWPMTIELDQPAYLALLIVLPPVVFLAYRSFSGLGSVRQLIAGVLRCLVFVCIALALAGPEWVRITDDQTVVFALDRSDSIPDRQKGESLEFVRQAAVGMRAGKDRVAVLTFAGGASIEQLPYDNLLLDRMGSPSEAHRTDLAGALRLAVGLFPHDTAKRLVVLTDGDENEGSVTREADSYAALGIPVDVVPLRYDHSAEILVDHLSAPATAARDAKIELQLVVRSQIATTARLLLFRNDRPVSIDPGMPDRGIPIRLDAGPNRFSIPTSVESTGVHRFHAIVQPDDPRTDTILANNEGRGFTIVGEPERVLIVTDPAGGELDAGFASAVILADALTEGGIEVDRASLDVLPADPAALSDCSTVILSNVPAFSLGDSMQKVLASFVRDQGGGLIAVGGDRSFSVGGYAHTPLEEVLPVETSRDEVRILSLSMVLVIDRSGSMAGEKIAMARKAALGSVQLLSAHDRVGVVAFDSRPEWVLRLQPAENIPAIAQRLSNIGSGGGTNMYPALAEATAALRAADSNLKHIIVLTDGQSAPGRFEALAAACNRNAITISTIAVGPDADRELLARIATLSGGRMYVARSAQPLPQIFAREVVLASRSGMYQEPFQPTMVSRDDELMVGFAPNDIPPLRGHVITNAKQTAATPLVRAHDDGSDPILACWQAGLGRAVAFTSGMWSRWGPKWVSWSGFGKLWTQIVRYAGRPGNPAELEVQTTVEGGEAHVELLAGHLSRNAQASLSVIGRVIAPDYTVRSLNLKRTSSERLAATFPLEAPGTYMLVMPYSYADGAEIRRGVLRSGTVMSYSPEYRTLTHDEAALTDLARRTDGRVLSPDLPATVFEKWAIRPAKVKRPIWELLVKIAAFLFLLDVAVRRIAIEPADVVEGIRRFVDGLVPARPIAESSTLGTLREVKARTGSGEDDNPTLEPEASPQIPSPADRLRRAWRRSSESGQADAAGLGSDNPSADESGELPRTGPPPASDDSTPSEEGTHTSRLLNAKKRTRRQQD